MKKLLPVIFVILVAFAGYFFLIKKATPPFMKFEPTMENNDTEYEFTTPKKSAHYESNTPAHESVLAAVPINIVIDFNFDLAKPSEIKILKGGTDYGIGETLIDNNKLAMRRTMNPNSPDGLYRVEYKACWPDRSCHDGYFEFAITRTSASTYEDLTGKKEVGIFLSQTRFMPMNIKISRGTKLIWTNNDGVDHYVNTDSHPAHTYFPSQNSKALKKGNTYSLQFDNPGVYPYHCSAHADSMRGSIIVE